MKKFLIILFYAFPLCAFAHAAPVSYEPLHGAVIPTSPLEIAVTMTERVDPASAALTLFSATGSPQVLSVMVDPEHPRTIHAEVAPVLGGATVVWGVTSLEDGHYTHGAFNFSVMGEESLVPMTTEKMVSEAHLAILLSVLAAMLIMLRLVSRLFLEKKSRCRTCLYSYTLLEVIMGTAVITVSALLFFVSPWPRWEMETNEDKITVKLHTTLGSSFLYITVSSLEDLPAPLFEISNRDASIDPMPITITPLVSSTEGNKSTTYSFPASVFVPYGNWHVSTTFVRGDEYDVHSAMMFAYPADVEKIMEESPIHSRTAWNALALSSFALFLAVWRRRTVRSHEDKKLHTN